MIEFSSEVTELSSPPGIVWLAFSTATENYRVFPVAERQALALLEEFKSKGTLTVPEKLSAEPVTPVSVILLNPSACFTKRVRLFYKTSAPVLQNE